MLIYLEAFLMEFYLDLFKFKIILGLSELDFL